MVRQMSTRGVTEVPIAMGKGKQRFGKYRAGVEKTSVPRISNSTASTVSVSGDDKSVFSYKPAADCDDFSTFDNYSVYDMSVVDGASCFNGGESVMGESAMGESLFDEQSMYHDNTVYGDDHSMYQEHLDLEDNDAAEPHQDPYTIPTNICLGGSRGASQDIVDDSFTNHDQSFTNHDQSHTSFSQSNFDHERDHEQECDYSPEEPNHTASSIPHTTAPQPVPILRKKKSNDKAANISVAPTDESSYEPHSPESSPVRGVRPSIADGGKTKSGLWSSFRKTSKGKSKKNKDLDSSCSSHKKKGWFSGLKLKRTKAEF